MEAILNPNWNKLAVITFAVGALASRMVAQAPVHQYSSLQLPRLEIETQMIQVKELLPRAPASLDVKNDGRAFIYETISRSLPSAYKGRAGEIAGTLIAQANKYHLDPIFLLAVIKTESRFNPLAHGRHGDIGLMQLLPKTGVWMANRLKLKGRIDLRDPILNIKIGAAYFAYLRAHFGAKGSRYLAAYNMGIRNVHKLLKEDKEPLIYAERVLKNYSALYAKYASAKQVLAAN
jgi:soluble lytic murein transglycosylase